MNFKYLLKIFVLILIMKHYVNFCTEFFVLDISIWRGKHLNSKLAELKVNQKHSAQMKQSFLVFFWPLQLPAIGTYLHDAIFG